MYGSRLGASILGFPGAIAGAIGGAMVGQTVGAKASDSICNVAENAADDLCASCKERENRRRIARDEPAPSQTVGVSGFGFTSGCVRVRVSVAHVWLILS